MDSLSVTTLLCNYCFMTLTEWIQFFVLNSKMKLIIPQIDFSYLRVDQINLSYQDLPYTQHSTVLMDTY